MRQNRSITSSKSQRNKDNGIHSLTSSLFDKIDDIRLQTQLFKPKLSSTRTQNFSLSQFDDLETIKLQKSAKTPEKTQSVSILQKAKQITNQNKNKIQKAKMMYKKANHQNEGMFLTGCGLYKVQQPQTFHNQDYQTVNMDDALKYLVSHEKDDLQQLRKMIKKTSFNIKQYSHQVNRTKNQVVNAADLFGKQLTTDLRIKINKYKPLSNDFCQFQEVVPKRKVSTNTSQIHKKYY